MNGAIQSATLLRRPFRRTDRPPRSLDGDKGAQEPLLDQLWNARVSHDGRAFRFLRGLGENSRAISAGSRNCRYGCHWAIEARGRDRDEDGSKIATAEASTCWSSVPQRVFENDAAAMPAGPQRRQVN